MDTDVLARLIDRKHEVLSQLRLLTERQRSTVGQGELSHLMGLLAAKQHVLNELQSVERELTPFRGQDPEGRRWRSAAERQRVRQLAEQCESLLRDIVRLEQVCEQELLERRDAAAARLQGTHSAAQATQAYAAAVARRGVQLDVSSDL